MIKPNGHADPTNSRTLKLKNKLDNSRAISSNHN